MIRFSSYPQGSEEWLQERRGRITGSRVKDALDTIIVTRGKAAKVDKKTGEVAENGVAEERGPSAKATLYAMDLARERVGGVAPSAYVNAAMRFGTEQEPMARTAYELERNTLVRDVGFFGTDDGFFGVSVDGLVDDDGVIEIKTMVSSDALFTHLVEDDDSDFVHQVDTALWLLNRKWCDLILWAPDMPKKLHVRRIERDDNRIDAMVDRLWKFNQHVEALAARLSERMV